MHSGGYGMNQYAKIISKYLEQNQPKIGCGEMKTLLEILYCCYQQRKTGDTQRIQAGFGKLDTLLHKFAAHEQSAIEDVVCYLCSEHQQEAFQDGLLTGFRLFAELADM